MDFAERAEHRDLRAAVASIASGFGPQYYVQHAAEHLPCDELWTKLGEAGFIGVNIPAEYGGGGGGLTELIPLLVSVASSMGTGRLVVPASIVATRRPVRLGEGPPTATTERPSHRAARPRGGPHSTRSCRRKDSGGRELRPGALYPRPSKRGAGVCPDGRRCSRCSACCWRSRSASLAILSGLGRSSLRGGLRRGTATALLRPGWPVPARSAKLLYSISPGLGRAPAGRRR